MRQRERRWIKNYHCFWLMCFIGLSNPSLYRYGGPGFQPLRWLLWPSGLNNKAWSIELNDELTTIVPEEDLLLVSRLNTQWWHMYNTILERTFSNKNGAFFVDGPGSNGKKIFVHNITCHIMIRKNTLLLQLPPEVSLHQRCQLPEQLIHGSNYHLI